MDKETSLIDVSLGKWRSARGIVVVILLVTVLTGTVNAATDYSLSSRFVATTQSPEVVLQAGNIANSTIFSPGTSARVTTPTLNYPTSYSILTGTYTSGTVPGSVNSQDSDYFITSSASQAISARQVGKPAVSTGTIPASQQRVFRNTRGQLAYYVFYNAIISTVDKCWYAYSTDGMTWTAGQDTTLGADYRSCSGIFREDPTNSRSIVYLTASKLSNIGTTRNIGFLIGTIADGSVAISWGSIQTVRSSASTETLGYPVIAEAADGYLHIVAAWTRDASGTSNDNQGIVTCSSSTTNPTSNPSSWTCNDRSLTTTANVDVSSYMPHPIPNVNGVDLLIIQGSCQSISSAPGTCSWEDVSERVHKLDWDGATQTFTQGTASFALSSLAPADERSAVVNATSGRVHYLYNDGTNLVSRYIDSPYTSWSSATTVNSGTTNGVHLAMTMGFDLTPKKLFAFYISGTTTISSRNATDSQSWGAAQTEYTNSSTAPRWVSTPHIVNNATGRTESFTHMPLVWVQQSATAELWFKTHNLAASAETQFSFSVSSTSPTQLNFTIVHQYNTASVGVTIKVWNYTANTWAKSSEAGYVQYTSSATAGTDETQSLSVTSGQGTYTSSGAVKIKIKGVVNVAFQQKSNLVRLYCYQQTYDYVLKIVNQQSNTYDIRLNAVGLAQTNLPRLSNFTAWFYTPGSLQLQVISGSFSTQTGSFYSLGATATAYIAIRVSATAGVSTIDCYLQIYNPGTSVHTDYRLTFKIT